MSDSRTDQCGKPLRGVVDGDGATCVAHHVARCFDSRRWYLPLNIFVRRFEGRGGYKGRDKMFLQRAHMRKSLHGLIEE